MPKTVHNDIIRDSLFRGIFESNIAGFAVADLTSGRIVAVNDRLAEITGASRETLLGKPDVWRDITPAEHHHLDELVIAQSLQRGSADVFETHYLRPDGSRVPVRVSCAAVPDRPGLTIIQVQDISAETAARSALAERELELAAAIRAGNLAVFEYDHAEQVMRGTPRLSELYGFPGTHQLTIDDIRAAYHPDDIERIGRQVAADNADPNVRHFDWQLHLRTPDGGERWVEGLGEYVRAPDGRIATSRGVAMDVTERVKSELHQRLMITELNHRVKNSLAVVQALAHQSFSRDKNRADALATFEGRLQALAAAHTILTEEKWENADLREITEAALEAPGALERVDISGPTVRIPPKFAVSLAMVLHELATNSIKYGALSVPGGRVAISWQVDDGCLALQWKERGGPVVEPPAERGFGTRMIERALAADAGGTVALEFARDGVECVVCAPVG